MSSIVQSLESAEPTVTRRPILQLFIFLTVMALAGFGYSIFQIWVQAEREARDTLFYINQQIAQSTRATFIKYDTILRVVGQELLRVGALENPEAGRRIIEDVAIADQGMVGFGFVRPDGQILLVNGIPAGKSLPNLLQQRESASSFREALDSPILQAGRPWFMKLFNEWVIPVRTTLRNDEGEPLAVMTAGYRITGGSTTWAELDLPDDIGVAVVREDGFLQYIHFVAGDELESGRLNEVYGSPTGSDLLALIQEDGGERGIIRFGERFAADNLLAVYRHLPEYGIYTITGLPTSSIREAFAEDLVGPVSLAVIYLLLASFGYQYAVRIQREHETSLTYLAHHDSLTGLPNRVLMRDYLEQALKAAQRDGQRTALFFIDLDRFKEVNDVHGHAQGDILLKHVAIRLQNTVRPNDTVARLGGDEFLVILPGIKDRETIDVLAQRVASQFIRPITIGNLEHRITSSIGIAIYPDDSRSVVEILQHGDIALFEAKGRGRARHVYFDPDLNKRAQRRSELRDALARAVAENQLTLYYQPQLDAASSQVLGVEALLRWHSPEHGEVSPVEFIPLAEETGLISDIGRFVLYQAMRDIKRLNENCGLDLCVAVNISAHQMLNESLSALVKRTADSLEFPCRNLTLELTESTLIREFESVSVELHALRRMGAGIAIDDFGTGYSSLSYLNQLPVTELKIDRSFVRDIDKDPNDRTLIASIIGLGRGQGVRLVAEGVETAEQARLLRELDCDILQGFYFSRPVPLDALQEYLGCSDGDRT
ncbi:MAG: EAL domain-containing protein [Thiogranum sp.]|nr:EAL domain-containing protein [Thiogranum sp.]